MRIRLSIFVILFSSLLVSCGGDNVPVIEVDNGIDQYKENMLNANKVISQSEETQLDEYISRRGWQMTKLDNGARIQVLKQGTGAKIDFEDSVTVQYRMASLSDKVFYDDKTETFVVGRHQTTVGLDRAVIGQTRGSHLRVALPSSLAYGVVGDGDRVPGRAVLIYDLKILK